MTGGNWKLQTGLTLAGENLLPNTTAPVSLSLSPSSVQSLPYGTGPGTGTIVVSKTYLLAAGQSVTVNLFDGSLTDMAGAVANFRLLRGYAIWVASGGDAVGLTIGNAGSNPHPLFFGGTAQTKTVFPSGPADTGGSPVGVAVTATACNVLLVNNSAVPLTVGVNFAGTQCVTGVPMGLANLLLTYP